LYWTTSKADYFIYGCDKLYIGVDHKPLLACFRKVDPKPLDHIVNKRLRKYVSEINSLRFTIFHISGAKNYLADRGSRFPSGGAGDDRGESSEGTKKSDRAAGDKSTVNSHTASSDLPADMPAELPADFPADVPDECPAFARCTGPAFDADHMTDDIGDSEDYVSQAMIEVASMLSVSAGRQVSVAMEKLGAEIRSDTLYKYLRQTLASGVHTLCWRIGYIQLSQG
jgi:hypothetical protein